jgi:putative membrane-bound dehydrogenase-like protein
MKMKLADKFPFFVFYLLLFLLTSKGCLAAQKIDLPAGFEIQIFASDLGTPRHMAVSPAGDLFVADMGGGKVFVLPDKDGDGKADQKIIFAEGLKGPHSIAFFEDGVYISVLDGVVRFTDKDGDLKGEDKKVLVSGLPTGGHSTKTISFGPDGKMYVSVGSSCNVCEERDPRRAAILQYNADGTGEKIFAKGLRNSVGLTWHPQTQELWAADNGRDMLGDDLPPEEINIIKEGGHYGWPYCYGDQKPNPEFKDRVDFCKKTIPPVISLQAHSAPLGLTFYTGNQFPEEYQGNLFVAFHGSWNRTVPTGYKVIRIKFKDGQPEKIEDFATGWLQGSSAWGRPVDVVVGKDGALYVSDDKGGVIYRIFYKRG